MMVVRTAIALLWLAALTLGCGGLDTAPPDAGADGDATIEASSNDGFGFGEMPLPPPPDAALVDVYVTLDDGGGLFQCDNATCDGRTQYCDTSSIGPPGPARCADLPDGCVPANCECLPNANWGAGCSCEHATTGDGLVAGCAAP